MILMARRCNVSPRLLITLSLTVLLLYAISTTTHLDFQDGNVAVRLREHPTFNPLARPEQVPEQIPEEEKERVYKFDANKDIIIGSRRNPTGDALRIDSRGLDKELFNPQILELPAGSEHEFMIIARIGHVDANINGKAYRRAQQVAFFAKMVYDERAKPLIQRSGEWNRTILEEPSLENPEHHCASEDVIDKYIGPEDTRLYWTHAGAPMLMFTHQVNNPGECQGMFMIDARAAIPELVTAFGEHASLLPKIEISKPRQLRRPSQEVQETSWNYRFEREKNWAAFQHPPLIGDKENTNPDDLFFHVQPEAPRIYRFVRGQKYVASVAEPSKPQTCLRDVVDEGLHQGTPLLSLTMCKRGECEPDQHNTILLGIVQKRRLSPYLWYDGRIVTWNATAPFEFRSISKRVMWKGIQERQYNWNCGLIYHWNSTTVPENRSHGFLDDEMWVTYGVTDHLAGWIDVLPDDLLKDHTMCN